MAPCKNGGQTMECKQYIKFQWLACIPINKFRSIWFDHYEYNSVILNRPKAE